MSARLICFAFVLVLTAVRAWADAPQGVPRELARARAAEISGLRYRLSFALTPRASTTQGIEEIRFKLGNAGALLLDFRDGAIQSISLNGASISTAIVNGHVHLPADKLRRGDNTVRV